MNGYARVGPSVRQVGVLKPVDLMPVRISHRDTRLPLVALAAVDGSTRVFICHEAQGLEDDPAAAFYRYAGNRARLNSDINRVLQLQNVPAEELDDGQRAQLATVAIPAFVVVGIDFPPGRRFTAVDAADDILEDAHVNPPVAWGRAGRHGQAANRVLRSMRDAGILDQDTWSWFVNPRSDSPLSNQTLDVRAAHIAHLLLDSAQHEAIRAQYRAETGSKIMKLEQKAELVAELCMRGFDERPLDERSVDGLASVYGRALKIPQLHQPSRWLVSGREPGELLDAALAELSDPDSLQLPGPAALELGILALYWLVQKGAFYRELKTAEQARSGLGEGSATDYRAPNVILTSLLLSRNGLLQLHRAVVDGRAGVSNIRVVDADGTITVVREVRPSDGVSVEREKLLTSAHLRDLATESAGLSRAPIVTVPPSPPRGPRQQFRHRVQDVIREIDQLALAVRDAESIQISITAGPAWRSVGASPDLVSEASQKLSSIVLRLGAWAGAYDGDLRNVSAEVDDDASQWVQSVESDLIPEVANSGFLQVISRTQNSRELIHSALPGWRVRLRDEGHLKGQRIEIFSDGHADPVAIVHTQPTVQQSDAQEWAGDLLLFHGRGQSLPRMAITLLTG
jgi:hypothetical protein